MIVNNLPDAGKKITFSTIKIVSYKKAYRVLSCYRHSCYYIPGSPQDGPHRVL